MLDVWTTRAVAAFVFLTLFVLIGILCFVEIPKPNHDIVVALSGSVTTAAITIVSFFFGSSKSSQDKDDTIKQIATGESKP